MAEGLLIDEIPCRVLANSWVERPALYQGERMRMAAGNVISTEAPATRKRVAECTLHFLTGGEESALRAAVSVGIGVQIDGELPGVGFIGLVDIGPTTALRSIGAGGVQVLRRVAPIHIEEA